MTYRRPAPEPIPGPRVNALPPSGLLADDEYDARLLARMRKQMGRTDDPTWPEQREALTTAAGALARGAADLVVPQSPLDAALMVAAAPLRVPARAIGAGLLAAAEPSEAEAAPLWRRVGGLLTEAGEKARVRYGRDTKTPGAEGPDGRAATDAGPGAGQRSVDRGMADAAQPQPDSRRSRILREDELAAFARRGPGLNEMREIDPRLGGGAYQRALAQHAATNRYGAAVYVGSPDEYTSGKRLFMPPDRTAGFALADDDIVGVFKADDSPHKGFADAALPLAVQEGGRRLDAFDTQLPDIYSRSNFRVIARTPFNDEFAPPGLDYERFGAWNQGRPDVVFMAHDPRRNRPPYERGQGRLVPDYGAGLEEVRRFLARHGLKGMLAATVPAAAANDP
jgi:hypothetical protein